MLEIPWTDIVSTLTGSLIRKAQSYPEHVNVLVDHYRAQEAKIIQLEYRLAQLERLEALEQALAKAGYSTGPVG